jgi:hypothetical protein
MRLDLIKNSHSFLCEAVQNAIDASRNEDRWPFAILHVVQSLELTLKAMLAAHHRLFIYEDIDSPSKTVSISKAIERLSNPELGFSDISNTEKQKIGKAIDLRNRITHFEFDCSPEYAGAKFAEVFGLVTYLQSRHLKVELDSLIDPKQIVAVISHEKSFEELHSRAIARINEEGISRSLIWNCPECNEETFVAENGVDICYLCRHSAPVIPCPRCKELFFAEDLKDFSNFFDYSKSDGQYWLESSYGYSYTSACEECIPKIKDDIEERRLDEFNDWLEFESKLQGL